MRVILRAGLACLLVLLLGVPAARANHTPIPGTVALVGSLQSELGCPGRLAARVPAQTRLQPVAGLAGRVPRDVRRARRQLRVQGRAQRLVG